MNIQQVPAHSNNFEKGRQGNTVKKIVIHWIVGKLAAADAVFTNGNNEVSAHYGIGNTVVHQYVQEEDTAYHAGNLTVNKQSIGIEHEGSPTIAISDLTYKTSAELVADICRRYKIPVDREHIIKHSEVKATQCPGTFDMDKLLGMVKQILVPTPDVDMQKELDKVRAERDRNWTWFAGLCELLGKPADFTIASEELKKLITIEDTANEKAKQLEEATKKIEDLQVTLTTLKENHEKTVQENENLSQEILSQGATLSKVTEQLEELKKRCNLPILTGFKKFLYDTFIR